MSNRSAAFWILFGICWLWLGSSNTGGLWERISPLQWDIIEAEVIDAIWLWDKNSVNGRITFKVKEHPEIFQDRVFVEPLRISKVPKLKIDKQNEYKIENRIAVRFNGEKALLKGFPDGVPTLNLIRLLLGILAVLRGSVALLKFRAKTETPSATQTLE